MGKWYQLHQKLFVKMILVFIVITVLTITALSFLIYSVISEQNASNELNKQKQALEQVRSALDSKHAIVQNIVENMYREQLLADHITYFLKHSYVDYVEYRLDQFSLPGSLASKGLGYFTEALADTPDMENMILYSTEKQFIYGLSKAGSPKLLNTSMARSFVPDAMSLPDGIVTIPNVWMRKALNQHNERIYAVRKTINDVGSQRIVGELIAYYSTDEIANDLYRRSPDFKGTIMALTADGRVLFDSSGEHEGRTYPYMDQLMNGESEGKLDTPSHMTTLYSNLGYIVAGIIPDAELDEVSAPLRRLVISGALACCLIVILVPSLLIANFAKRTNNIVRFMRKVQTGDMTQRIPDRKKDELGQIAQSFNLMLDELNLYIDRVYKAEIKQKHMELADMQARIHPHFLYNTLEVIRMRALSSGAADVGEMIYSLSVLFKSFIRPQTYVSLKEEIELCRQYLELFRIRYKDRFRYELDVPQDLRHVQTVRMCLQPIVENYIVHGIRTSSEDNFISIEARRDGDLIRIDIEDNGLGIDDEKLAKIQMNLSRDSESLGLRSVNERLKLIYGKPYGLEITSTPGSGTKVTVVFPDMQQEEPE